MQVGFADLYEELLPGYFITEALQEQKHNSHGALVKLQSSSEYGFAALKAIVHAAPSDRVAVLPHISEVLHADGDIVVTAVTGLGQQNSLSQRRGKRTSQTEKDHAHLHEDGVTTFLSLRTSDDEIARCLLTWNNADCAELGPNIEMLAVHQCRRGQGWLHKFYSMTEQFVLSHWTMTGRTEDGKKRCRIFASYLIGTEVETRRPSNGKSESACDKDHFLKYQGFDVRFDAMNCIGGCLADEDAVKYINPKASRSL